MKSRINKRNRGGVAIAEAAASLSLLLPLIFLLIYVIVEISNCYLLKSALAQGARQAARQLAIAYGQDPTIATSRGLQDSQIFEHIRIHNIINANEQFDDPQWTNGVNEPHTVSVRVRYLSNQHGLPPFPNPDVLHLGNSFQIISDSTYRLE